MNLHREARAQTFLIKDGQPCAQIVTAATPPRATSIAAQQLQEYLEKISGAKLPIVTAPAENGVTIYVGRSTFTDQLNIKDDDLKYGAYRMISGDRYLVLLGYDEDFIPHEPFFSGGRLEYGSNSFGEKWDKLTGQKWEFPYSQTFKSYNGQLKIWENDERGSINAVYAFLYDLGTRWYLPDPLGEILPHQASITIPKINKTVHPDFGLRYPYQYGRLFGHPPATREEVLWQLRMGYYTGYKILGQEFGPALSHGVNSVISRDGIREAHPEWFALFNNMRDHDAPCLSSPELRAEVVKYARFMFDHYNQPMISIMPSDGYMNLCGCALCVGKSELKEGIEGKLSDYVWEYVDSVARELYKTHPDHKVSCFAYTSYLLPPKKIKQFTPNVVVGICQTRTTFIEPSQLRMYTASLRRDWLEKLPQGSKQLIIYDYYLTARPQHPNEHLPVFSPHIIANDLRSLKGISLGEFIEVYRDPSNVTIKQLGVGHLNLYVTSRLWWNADLDIDALLEEYYTLYYGPAHKEMKAYIEYSEKYWIEMSKDPVKIRESFALLDLAQKKVPIDSVYAKRIALIADYVQPVRDLAVQLERGRENAFDTWGPIRSGQTVKFDGKLDEEVWQHMSTYTLRELETGREPYMASSFKAFWSPDNKSIYMGITCQDRDMKNLVIGAKTDGDTNIFLGDEIEILLETQSHSYYQLIVSPTGALVTVDRKGGHVNSHWSSNAQVAAHHSENAWTLEIRIPIIPESEQILDPNGNGVAGVLPTKTFPWYLNVCRQRIRENGSEYSALSPTGTNHFAILDKFAKFYIR